MINKFLCSVAGMVFWGRVVVFESVFGSSRSVRWDFIFSVIFALQIGGLGSGSMKKVLL